MTAWYDTHMHTPLCKHARGEPEEYAEAAARIGLSGITITCHNPIPGGFAAHVRMEPDQFDSYLALVERARRAMAGRVDVLLGIESDYFPGMENYLEELHSRAPFNYVLGSVHPHTDEYLREFFTGDHFAFCSTYFRHLADAAETGLFDCISHPDLVKNQVAEHWEVGRVLDVVCEALDRIAKTKVSMELNTSGLLKTVREMNPGLQILREMRAREIPVVIGSDAHSPNRVGADFRAALASLEAAGYNEVGYFIARKRIAVSIAEARATLKIGEL